VNINSTIPLNSHELKFTFNKSLLFLFLIYFCFPKISFINIGNFDVRFLDVISIFITIITFTKLKIPKNIFVFFSLFFLLQLIIGYFYNDIISFLYVFRLFQYIVLGFGFYLLMTGKYKITFIKFFLIIQFTVCILQYLLVLPNYDPGRGVIYSSEFSGTFGTPAEFTYFLISLVSIFMGLTFFRHMIFVIPPSLSGVLFGTFLMFISVFRRMISLIPKILMIVAPYIFLLFLVLYFIDFETIKNFLLDPGFESKSLTKGESINPRELDGPTTLLMRGAKFIDALLYMLNNIFVLMFGCGYGCGSGAMDSGVVRIILEFGILFSLVLFFTTKHISKYTLFVLISVNFLFDGFWSSHVAPVLFAAIFYDLNSREKI